MRCRVYWRDEVDGDEELAREPAVLPETCRQEERGQKVRWRMSTGSLMFDIFKGQWWQCLLTGLRNRTILVVVIKSEILTHYHKDDIRGRAHLDLATIALAVWVGTSDGWACRFSADIRGPLRMIPNNFSDLLTSPLAPTWLRFCMKRLNIYWIGLSWDMVQTFMFPTGWTTFRGEEMSRCGRGLIKSKLRFILLLVLNDEEISVWRNMDKLIISYIVIESRSLNQ